MITLLLLGASLRYTCAQCYIQLNLCFAQHKCALGQILSGGKVFEVVVPKLKQKIEKFKLSMPASVDAT